MSLHWDDPSTFEFFVTITDTVDPLLNEIVRVLVTVNNANEAPVLAGESVTILERTRIGTKVFSVVGSDPDHFDFLTYAIVAGNTGNAFAIDPNSGLITVVSKTDFAVQSSYSLTVRATDQVFSPKLTKDATVAITVLPAAAGYSPGVIARTLFEDIGNGAAVADLNASGKFPNNPDSEQLLAAFEAGADHGDNYGSTLRVYLIPSV